MRNAMMVGLAASVSIFSTLSILLDHDGFSIFGLTLLLVLAVALSKFARPWWLGSLLFGLMGVSHLFGRWWLRSRGSAPSPALDTCGPGFLALAVFYFLRNRHLAGQS
jgi:protein-S-isoprenylcysteine O-methyltransferase Ste14